MANNFEPKGRGAAAPNNPKLVLRSLGQAVKTIDLSGANPEQTL
jgi:hypothetical protein